MPKTITLRLDDNLYNKFYKMAVADNRTISNLIETLAVEKLNEDIYADDFEMKEILSNKPLVKKLAKGHHQAKNMKGKMVG